jgi:hypothetical protein
MSMEKTAFLKDLIQSAVLSGGALALTVGIPALALSDNMEMGILFSILLVFRLHLLVPLGFLLYGLLRNRPGFACGPVVMLGAGIAFMLTSQLINARVIESMQVREFHAATKPHTVIAFDNLGTGCDTFCMQLLADSNHTVATRNTDGTEWLIYRKGSGATCGALENQASLLAFVRAGFAGICAIPERQVEIKDALKIRSAGWHLSKEGKIHGFDGKIYELSEVEGGRETLLGRWIDGRAFPVPMTVMTIIGFGHHSKIGPPFKTEEFISAALGTELSYSMTPGTASVSELLDALAPTLANPALRQDLVSTYREIGHRGGNDRMETLRPRIEEFLSSNDPVALDVGLALLDATWQLDVRFARPHIERLLASEDPQLLAAGVRGLSTFKQEDRAFARERLLEIALSPIASNDKTKIAEHLRDHLVSFASPLPKDVRLRAAAALAEDWPTREHRRLFLTIICRGGPAMRQEASKAIFALKGPAFLESVLAVGSEHYIGGWRGLDRDNPEDWTSHEIELLLERLPEVPSDLLLEYVASFSRSEPRDVLLPQLTEALRRRLVAVRAASMPDEDEVRRLNEMVDSLAKGYLP